MNFSCTNIECIYIGNAVGGAILACVANYWCPIVNSSKAFSVVGASGYVQHPENSPKPEFWNGAVKQTLLLANMPCGDMWNYVVWSRWKTPGSTFSNYWHCAKIIVTMFKVLTIGQNNNLHMINDFMPVHSLAMKEGTAFLLPHCGLSACNAFLSGGWWWWWWWWRRQWWSKNDRDNKWHLKVATSNSVMFLGKCSPATFCVPALKKGATQNNELQVKPPDATMTSSDRGTKRPENLAQINWPDR